MSVKNMMAGNAMTADTKSAIRENLYKSERAYRLDRRVDAWAKIPEIGDGLKSMDEAVARNVACNLDNQAAFMTRLDETQMSQGFKGFTPENMLRLVRLAMPNVVRNKIFTEFAMETAYDSIQYVEPIYEGGSTPVYEQVADQTQKAITKTTSTHPSGDFIGYKSGAVVCVKMNNEYLVGADDTVIDSVVEKGADINAVDGVLNDDKDNITLGEVELRTRAYRFEPKALTLGVSWTMLSEIILDGSYGVSSEELLLDSAAGELKKALDYQSIALAWKCSDATAITFSAMNYGMVGGASNASIYNGETYFQRAQVVGTAINKAKNAIYNTLKRGGISAIVGDADSVEYLKLNKAFEAKGAQVECGAYKAGEFNGIPLFVAPNELFGGGNHLMTTWTNESAGADTALAIGTFMPFFSTGVATRKQMFKESGIARFEDEVIMEKRYLKQITLTDLL